MMLIDWSEYLVFPAVVIKVIGDEVAGMTGGNSRVACLAVLASHRHA
jgi:hypothetical protein